MTAPEQPPEKAPLATIPEFTSAQIEEGRLLFARDVTFMLSVVKLEQLPPLKYARPHARAQLF